MMEVVKLDQSQAAKERNGFDASPNVEAEKGIEREREGGD